MVSYIVASTLSILTLSLGILCMVEEAHLNENDKAVTTYGKISCVCLCVVSLCLLGSITLFLYTASKLKDDMGLAKDA